MPCVIWYGRGPVREQADDGADDRADRLATERRRRVDDHDPSSKTRGFERRGNAGDAGADDADVGANEARGSL